jgi:hypothetical protein
MRVNARARLAGAGSMALLPPAAFAAHQLRYLLAYGGPAGLQLPRTGHSYVHSVVPWPVVLLAGDCEPLGEHVSGGTCTPGAAERTDQPRARSPRAVSGTLAGGPFQRRPSTNVATLPPAWCIADTVPDRAGRGRG